MNATVSPQLNDLYAALRAFIQGIVGSNIDVIRGLGNRVPMPQDAFISLTAVTDSRLSTNIDTDFDGFFSDPPTPGITSSDEPTQLDLQIDCYGPSSHDWAKMLATLFRDDYAVEALAPVCAPLYADNPTLMPLVSAEDQYIERWMLLASIQYDPVTVTAQSFYSTLDVTAIEVDVRFPPGA